MLKFYNTLTRKKEDFESLEKDLAKVYSCGPTVYSSQHIGNLRSALFADFLKRSLRYFKFTVIDVVNITDVGHLVSDESDGEDKMLKASKKEKKDPYEIARCYEDEYKRDLERLNIFLPKFMPRATEHISGQIALISALEGRGFTYQTSDGMYFDTSKYEDYGKLSGQKLEDKKVGARVQKNSDKRNPQDFALWKFLTGDNANHIMRWESPWGLGFPGWHLECSAMSKEFLGSEFDIHTGGIDHIPIHHENELAQNVCSHSIERINFWMHHAHMLVNNEKMSKSLGNVYLLSDLIEKGYEPLALRELCLRTHYRKTLNFTFESLDSAAQSVKRIHEFQRRIYALRPSEDSEDYLEKAFYSALDTFEGALKDDLNTPLALSALYEFMNEVNKHKRLSKTDIDVVKDFLERTDLVLGLLEKSEDIPYDVVELARARYTARLKKDFAQADELRKKIEEKGFIVRDDKESQEGFLLDKV
jgi:cysteinyl-tRNA synthetase